MPTVSHPDLLVGISTGDDAVVWRVDEHRAFVSTVDFFTPVVDDAFTWGRIAAANSASDVYAMGGRPLFALNVAAWPRELLPLELLGDVLAGAANAAEEGGWLITGGHTVDGPEPMFGQSVTGEVAIDKIMTNDGGRVGDVLVLTKPLGTGLITTAIKRESAEAASTGWLAPAATEAIAMMSRLNASAATVANRNGVRGATDVTGFGLAGHLHKLASASGVGAQLSFEDLPLFASVRELIDGGFVPGGTGRNLAFVGEHLVLNTAASDAPIVLADPQTSGGLLLCVPPDRVADVVHELRAAGETAAVIGELTPGEPGRIVVN